MSNYFEDFLEAMIESYQDYPWSSLVEGDEGYISPSGKMFKTNPNKISGMVRFYKCLIVRPIQLFISFY